MQVISFYKYLFDVERLRGPFLVVVPLSTLPQVNNIINRRLMMVTVLCQHYPVRLLSQ